MFYSASSFNQNMYAWQTACFPYDQSAYIFLSSKHNDKSKPTSINSTALEEWMDDLANGLKKELFI